MQIAITSLLRKSEGQPAYILLIFRSSTIIVCLVHPVKQSRLLAGSILIFKIKPISQQLWFLLVIYVRQGARLLPPHRATRRPSQTIYAPVSRGKHNGEQPT